MTNHNELADFTVMGPGKGSTPNQTSDILSPPFLSATTDKFKWRKQVQLWATAVKRFAKGGDKRAKGMLSALGLTLFNALDTVFASKVERSITAGLLSLDADDDNNDEINSADQLKVVQDIISIVAKDTPTDGIKRLVQMMRSVYGCTRKDGESTALYARRFQGLALEYLNHCDTVAAEQDSQNFAMLLLENARLPSSVYSTVITQLVSTAGTKRKSDEDLIYIISKAKLEAILQKAMVLLQVSDNDESRDELVTTATSIKDLVSAAIRSNKRHENEDRTSFRVTLDDAVEVLADLKVDDNNLKVNQAVTKTIGAMLGKRGFQDTFAHNGRDFSRNVRSKTRIPSGQGPKAQTRCRACKQPNHWYSDPECIYNVMKCLLQGKNVDPKVIEKQSEQVKALFKKADDTNSKVRVSGIVEVIAEDGNQKKDEQNSEKLHKSYFR